ncbi:hypothetical protein SY85_13850 [Flavisolibacter tropicus]|uniref:TonB C-terminal domain-containing protein n=2 Tax=Flavisolibacter tropicus TaxID=1492898 RepID=A0A172TXG6_9BACT|nr:hypothetical protein SY85_13850 [Flavisolibacter tropicus]
MPQAANRFTKGMNMQKAILLVLLFIAGSITTQAQSLKELLYGGKLKMDSNTVLRKTDDLKSRIDTAQKKPAEPAKPVVAVAAVDSVKKVTPQGDTVAVASSNNNTAVQADTAAAAAATVAAAAAAVPPPVPVKTNTKIWKEYSDSLVASLTTEVLPSKKIKKETYYITVAYEIETTGQVNITNVTTTPENAFLLDQVKQRLVSGPPQLNPVLDSNNQPRKAKRGYNFSVTKD